MDHPVAILEREIKLPFAEAAEARVAVIAAGATPLRDRRLQEDYLLDTPDQILQHSRCALRVRMEAGRSSITFKGPAESAIMKVREELETLVGDGGMFLDLLGRLGFHVWFRYQKYREEYAGMEVVVAIDETPVGTFVEIEGSERGITSMAAALSRTPDDYVTESYRTLFVRHCQERGLPVTDMLFHEHA